MYIWGIIANQYSKKLTFETQSQPYIDLKYDGTRILIAEINASTKILSLVNGTWQQDLDINKITDALIIQQDKFTLNPLLQQTNNDDWLNFTLQRYAIIETSQNQTENYTNTITFTESIFTNSLSSDDSLIKKQIENIIYTKSHTVYTY